MTACPKVMKATVLDSHFWGDQPPRNSLWDTAAPQSPLPSSPPVFGAYVVSLVNLHTLFLK